MYHLYVRREDVWEWRAKSEATIGLKEIIEALEDAGLDRSRDMMVSFGRASDNGLPAREEGELGLAD